MQPLTPDKQFKSWKYDIARKYGFFRLDLFMIGLLWLKLLNKDIDDMTQNSLSLEEMYPQVQEFKKTIQHVNNSQLIEMLLDLESNPNLLLDNVILEFDQWIIIVIKKQEELVSSDVSNPQNGDPGTDINRGTGAFEEMNRRTEEEDVHIEESERHGEQSEIIKKNLSNNLTRSKAGTRGLMAELNGKKNVFADPHTETENDTPNASKSIIKVHNGNISLAGDESSLLGGRLNETIESEINTSRHDGTEVTRMKGHTFGEKKVIGSNKILGEEFQGGMHNEYGRVSEMRNRRVERRGGDMGNDFEPNKMVDEADQDLEGIHREVIYDQKEAIKNRGGQSQTVRYSEQNPKSKGETKPGKSYSISTKVEHRTIHKNMDSGHENFGSSRWRPNGRSGRAHGKRLQKRNLRAGRGQAESRFSEARREKNIHQQLDQRGHREAAGGRRAAEEEEASLGSECGDREPREPNDEQVRGSAAVAGKRRTEAGG